MACEDLNIRQLRMLALNLQDKVNRLYADVAALHQTSSVWNLTDIDELLPDACTVSQAINSYKLLSIEQISSITAPLANIIDCCQGVIGTEEIVPLTIQISKTSIVRQTTGPVTAGVVLDNDLVVGQPFEMLQANLLVGNTGTGGNEYLQGIRANGVSLLAARPPILPDTGPQSRIYDAFTQTLFTGTEVFSFPVDSAPDGCEDVTLTLWLQLL